MYTDPSTDGVAIRNGKLIWMPIIGGYIHITKHPTPYICLSTAALI